MVDRKAGDRFLGRLVSKARHRRLAQVALAAAAAGAIWFRVIQGRTEQGLPWEGGLLCFYAFAMAGASSDPRCRGAWAAFGLLILASFAPTPSPAIARAAGLILAGSALCLLVLLRSLAADPGIPAEGAVLKSGEIRP